MLTKPISLFSLTMLSLFFEKIYVSGDNDVGGEHERVIPYLVGRFSRHFITTFDAATLGLQALNFVHVCSFVLFFFSSIIWSLAIFDHIPLS